MSDQCRICLTCNDCPVSLADRIDDQLIYEILNSISAAISISLNDGFPQKLCQNCVDRLSDVLSFRLELEKSDDALKNNPPVEVKLEESESEGGTVRRTRTTRKNYDTEFLLEDVKEDIEDDEEEFLYEDGTPDDDSDVPMEATSKRKARSGVGRKKKPSPKKINHEVDLITCCCLCQESVKDEDELRIHVNSFHQNQVESFLQAEYGKYTTRHKYECQFCRRKYLRKGSLDKHFEIPNFEEAPRKRNATPKKRTKNGDQGAVCTICGKMYYDKYDLELHELRMHATEKPIPCPHPGCDKRFAAEKLMKKHFRFHGERKHICETCGKGFIEPNDLRNHSYVHQKIKPLQCPLCPRTFTHKPVLETHILSHSGQNIFACEQCDKTYKWKEDLRKHFMAEHLGIFPYKCRHCGKGYTGSSNRTYHEKRCNNYLLKQEPATMATDDLSAHTIIITNNQSLSLADMTGL